MFWVLFICRYYIQIYEEWLYVYFINSLSGYDIVHLYNKGLTCIRQVYWKNLLFYFLLLFRLQYLLLKHILLPTICTTPVLYYLQNVSSRVRRKLPPFVQLSKARNGKAIWLSTTVGTNVRILWEHWPDTLE